MKHTLSMLAFSGLVAVGLAAGASSGQASALAASSGAANALKTVEASGATNVVEVDHRKKRWHRKHRKHRKHYRHRQRGPSAGFYFEFGTGGFHYRPHVVIRPPYHPPRVHVRPRYHASGLPAIHIRWCYNRFRSYRDWDNSFQPYHGPRRPCRSPYWP